MIFISGCFLRNYGLRPRNDFKLVVPNGISDISMEVSLGAVANTLPTSIGRRRRLSASSAC